MTEDELRELVPEPDVEFLLEKGWPDGIVVTQVGAELHVVFRDYALPPGLYQQDTSDLLVCLIPPYPNQNPDMFWMRTDVKLANGQTPDRAAMMEVPVPPNTKSPYITHWQRWSRHFNDRTQWRPGVDGLRSYLASIRLDLQRAR